MKSIDSKNNLRNKISKKVLQSEIPFLVYAIIFISMFLLWRYRAYNEDLALNFLAELFGAAFTLFIIDVLLVRSKTKRWKTVRDEMNYLIARNVNRIRDGISSRVFNFNPSIEKNIPEEQYLKELRLLRGKFLNEIALMETEVIEGKINEPELFSEVSYEYFNEKADEIWNIINFKYSDYFHPELASYLISLNINLKDLCGHIRQYLKSDRLAKESDTFKKIGKQGAIVSLVKIIRILNSLKNEGYSEAATILLQSKD
jgi:hypothetical protein